MNRKHLFFAVIATLVTPATVFASDFTILVVGLGAFMIAGLLIILGIIGTTVSHSKGLQKAVPYLIFSVILIVVGVIIVTDESDHMAKSDFIGLLVTILLPGILSLLIPVVFKKKKKT